MTGAGGFAGRHLIVYLKSILPDAEILGVSRSGRNHTSAVDLADTAQTNEIVSTFRPDQIYHLSGTITHDLEIDFRNNVLSTARLLEAVRKARLGSRILLTGSAAEYGIPNANPVCENAPLNPITAYGALKVQQTVLMKNECHHFDLDILMVRPFNLMGNEMPEHLFVGKVQRQIKDYKRGLISKIKVGDLTARRDYIDIKEALKDWVLVMNKGLAGEVYNIGSGVSVCMRDFLNKMLENANIPPNVVEENAVTLPPKHNVPDIYADMRKTRALSIPSKN